MLHSLMKPVDEISSPVTRSRNGIFPGVDRPLSIVGELIGTHDFSMAACVQLAAHLKPLHCLGRHL